MGKDNSREHYISLSLYLFLSQDGRATVLCGNLHTQILVNVTVMTATAMRMQTALTQREVSLATVTLATLGMGSTV